MKVFLHEIKESESELDFTESEKWVLDAISTSDEHLDENIGLRPSKIPSPVPPRPANAAPVNPKVPEESLRPEDRKAQVHFSLRRLDSLYMVTGTLHTGIRLNCSRCLKAFLFPANSDFSSIYSKDPVMAGMAHLGHSEDDPDGEVRPQGQNQGHARHAHDFEGDEDALASRDVEIQYLKEDFVSLSDVLKEQLQLQVPFQPLCSVDCKGLCANCGADLNTGRCACAKLSNNPALAGLKNFTLRKS